MAYVGARIAVHGRPRDVAQRAREQIGEHAFRLDDATVAEAGLARRFWQTVDQRDGSAARLKRERRRDADNSGPEHDGVNGLRGHGTAALLSRTRRAAMAAPSSILNVRSYRPGRERTNRKRRP